MTPLWAAGRPRPQAKVMGNGAGGAQTSGSPAERALAAARGAGWTWAGDPAVSNLEEFGVHPALATLVPHGEPAVLPDLHDRAGAHGHDDGVVLARPGAQVQV